jgi:hypothetical protein
MIWNWIRCSVYCVDPKLLTTTLIERRFSVLALRVFTVKEAQTSVPSSFLWLQEKNILHHCADTLARPLYRICRSVRECSRRRAERGFLKPVVGIINVLYFKALIFWEKVKVLLCFEN